MKDIFAGKMIKPGPVLSSRKSVAAVKKVIDDVRPLSEWLRRHI
jgi:hypothetical protein